MGARNEAGGSSEAADKVAAPGTGAGERPDESTDTFVSDRRPYSGIVPSRPSMVVPNSIGEMHRTLAAVAEVADPVAAENPLSDPDHSPVALDLHDLRVLRHEVANPLTYLLNAALLMRREIDSHHCPRNAQLQEMIDIIDQAARQILGIIDSDKKKPSDVPPTDPSENPSFRRIDLSHMLRTLATSWKVLTDAEGIHFENDTEEDVFVLGDNTKLFEVLSNLMTNAIEVLRDVDSPSVSVTLRVHPKIIGLVQIYFTDNGPGIPEAIRNKLFSKGFSGKGGQGIGLWRSRRLVREMGGELSLMNNHRLHLHDELKNSAEQAGATAVVELPILGDPRVGKSDSA